MREKELRIALVCFGGVSLAVYMHGITKEILKLARASSALHAITDRGKRRRRALLRRARRARSRIRHRGRLFRSAARHRPHRRAARHRRYHCGRLGRRHQWHHAGARAQPRSADGPLARPMAGERRRHRAAGARSAGRAAGANGFSGRSSGRPRLQPAAGPSATARCAKAVAVHAVALVQAAVRRIEDGGLHVRRAHRDGRAAQRAGVAAAVRPGARPVRDGDGFLRLPAADADPRSAGHPRARAPSRASFQVSAPCRAARSRAISSCDNAPALAFAARATSSIPGAFPPARILEMDALVRARGVDWPGRAEFIASNFEPYDQANVDVASVPFIDGSVFNSRPFREAITAIQGRPALSRGRSQAGLHRSQSGACGHAGAPRHSGLLHHAQGRAVGHSAGRAGDRRIGLDRAPQRAGAPIARHHRQRAAAYQPAGRRT